MFIHQEYFFAKVKLFSLSDADWIKLFSFPDTKRIKKERRLKIFSGIFRLLYDIQLGGNTQQSCRDWGRE
jgi:hypothetical protein